MVDSERQLKLPYFASEVITSEQERRYFTRVRILRGLVGHTPLLELRRLQNVSKQALNRLLNGFKAVGWVENQGYGVWEVTESGKNWLLKSNHSPIVGSVLKSVHHFKVRFNLKGNRFDRAGLRMSRKGHWIDYLDSEGVTIEATKRGLFVNVHGLRGSNALDLAQCGVERAREAALGFCARRGARIYAVGELVQAPHWVLEDKAVSKALIDLLDLRKGKNVQAGGLTWFTDASHEGFVEAKGSVLEAVAAFKEFDYLVSGGLRRDLLNIKSELGGVKEVANEVRLLREELRFVPSNKARIDVA